MTKNIQSSKQERRFEAIMERLRASGSANVDDLCAELGVSVHTIRRDLETMHDRGMLRRTHGGAAQLEPLFYEAFKSDRSFQEQMEKHAEAKRRIAQAAALLVKEGDTIAATAGTTTMQTMRFLPHNKRLTVVTNTVNVAMELCKRDDIDVFMTGGHLRGTWFSLVGPSAVDSIRKVIIDTLFIGTNSIHPDHGLTVINPDEAEFNRAMVQQAMRKIVVADSSKFGSTSSWLIATTDSIDDIVTDNGIDEHVADIYRKRGITVHIV
jgi:DeoR family transcriptional regulator of aga operon